MAVIIQEMVHAQVSGVAFSLNPISSLDEFIVEAVQGNGAQLVQDGVTPHRWVYKWGIWKDKPDHEQISTDLIDQVVKQGLSNIFRKRGEKISIWNGLMMVNTSIGSNCARLPL